MDKYVGRIIETAIKWYKGETDHTDLADAIQAYLLSQKKEIVEIEPLNQIDVKVFANDFVNSELGGWILLVSNKIEEVIRAVNQMRKNEK